MRNSMKQGHCKTESFHRNFVLQCPSLCFIKYLVTILLRLHLSHLHRTNLQWQAEQGDKSVCVMVVIEVAGGEGSQGLAV